MKIGLIQTQGIGDIIIGLPIAKWLADRGHEVFWPITDVHIPYMQPSAPYLRFLPVTPYEGLDFMRFSYDLPLKLLQEEGCEKVHVLNMNLPYDHTMDRRLAASLKFDEYKFAVAGVPFSEKWNLFIKRDMNREMALYKSLALDNKDYICIHSEGSSFKGKLNFPSHWDKYQQVEIKSLTDNPFDWLYTIEHAAKRVLLDSMFANLVEQLNMPGEHYLIQRSVIALTPVFKNGWRFCWPGDTIQEI